MCYPATCFQCFAEIADLCVYTISFWPSAMAQTGSGVEFGLEMLPRRRETCASRTLRRVSELY